MALSEPQCHRLAWPLGGLAVYTRASALLRIEFLARRPEDSCDDHPAIDALQHWIRHGVLPEPDACWSIEAQGTPFQKKVWAALRGIPNGETRSYGALAQQLGTGARAVANACRHNPVPIVVPCHRVVARNGLGGFSGQMTGAAVQRKAWMLRHEGAIATVQLSDSPAP